MRPLRLLAAVLGGLLAACVDGPGDGGRPLLLDAGIAATAPDAALAGALWRDPREPSRTLLLGATGSGGLLWQALAADGGSGRWRDGDVDLLAVLEEFDAGDGPQPLVLVHDRSRAAVLALTLDAAGAAATVRSPRPFAVEAEATGLCAWRSASSGRAYFFVADGEGSLQQWELHATAAGVDARRVRRLALGAGIGACAVDARTSQAYVADEQVGIWRVAAEPESDPARTLLDRTGTEGSLGEEVKGLALHEGVLLALGHDGTRLNAYALDGAAPPRSLPLGVNGTRAEVEFEALWAGPAGGAALLVAAQSDESGVGWRTLDWARVRSALGTVAAAPAATATAKPRPAVEPTVETEPVDDYGDAADDAAIWVHPRDPARSLVVTAQKKRGLQVFDLQGRSVQLLADGRMNNVDLRQGVDLGEGAVDIVAATNRTSRTLALYAIDVDSGRLRDVAAEPVPTGMRDPYGLCLYRSARDGAVYVLANDSDRGAFRQWRLESRGGRVGARLVREFTVGSQAEGCVADDETGALYVAEEDVGLWRYGAEPGDGDARTRIDAVAPAGRLAADVEGVALYLGEAGRGYLVVSNQGADDYAVYRRDGANEFVGLFSIAANDALGIDGASETDGLEVTSRPLGTAFPHGLLVVQDGRNLLPLARQNFKLVPWERVAAVLEGGADNGQAPRR